MQRLGLERVDIFHFHNPITVNGGGDSLSVRQMLDELVPAFERQRQRGKTRFLGITAVGDTAALHEVIDARVFDSAQVSYNMLNPSPRLRCRRTIRRKTTDGCSTTPRPPVSAW